MRCEPDAAASSKPEKPINADAYYSAAAFSAQLSCGNRY
jgi:hypothetical protein